MILTYALLALNLLAWGFLSFGGLMLMLGQQALGQASLDRWIYYLWVPLGVTLVSLIRPLWLMRRRAPSFWRKDEPKRGLGLLAATLLFLPIYLFPYTGGV